MLYGELAPNSTIKVRMLGNSKSRIKEYSDRLLIDLAEFPEAVAGVYVLRFAARTVARLRGESAILKIGQSGASFRGRFKAYNGKSVATQHPGNLGELLNWCTNAKTEFQLMWLLPKLLEKDEVALDLFITDQPKLLEKKLLLRHLEEHWELPPLNKSVS